MSEHFIADDGYWWCTWCKSTCRSDNPCDHCDDNNRALDDELDQEPDEE